MADLVGADEADLWPEVGGPVSGRSRPEELAAVYPHRWAIPRHVWTRFFESAEREIGILAYSALFLAEDAGLFGVIEDKAPSRVRVRLALGDPDSLSVALRGQEERIDNAISTKVRNALALYRPLVKSDCVDIRLHQTPLMTRFTKQTINSSSTVMHVASGFPLLRVLLPWIRRRQHDHSVSRQL